MLVGKSPVTVVGAAQTDDPAISSRPVIEVQASCLGLATSQQLFLTRDNQPLVNLGSLQASLPQESSNGRSTGLSTQ